MEEASVLVLNKNYLAIHVTSWKKAITLLYTGHAQALDEKLNTYNFEEWAEVSKMIKDYPNGYARSASMEIAIPEIIILTIYNRLPKVDVKFTRSNIYKAYGYKCCYCGNKFDTKDMNLDHVIPKSKGGGTTWNNIVLACIECNTKKADKTPEEVGFKMHYHPTKPNWRAAYFVKFHPAFKARESWQKFVDFVYWNSNLED